MTGSTAEIFERLPPDIQRAVVEGQPIRVFACRFKIAREGDITGLSFESLVHPTETDEYRTIALQLCEILIDQMTKLPRKSLIILKTLSKIMPEIPVAQIDVFITMRDGGSWYWTVAGNCNPAMEELPGFSQAFKRAGREALHIFTETLS